MSRNCQLLMYNPGSINDFRSLFAMHQSARKNPGKTKQSTADMKLIFRSAIKSSANSAWRLLSGAVFHPMAHAPVLSKGSREISSVPKIVLSAEQIHNLPLRLEAQLLILADDNSAQSPPAVSNDFHTPNKADQAHLVSVAEEMSMSCSILLTPPEPNPTQWNPGTQGLYPRLKGALSPNTSAWQKSFPLWKVMVDGLKPHQAMFQIADNL